MSTVPPVNIQQVLQMGTHAEKLQQTMQQLPRTSADHLDQERKIADEQKRKSVQNAESGAASTATDPNGKGAGQRRKRKRNASQKDDTPAEESARRVRGNQGETIDVVI